MPSIFITPAGIAGGLTSSTNLNIYAHGVTTFTPTNTGRIQFRERVVFADDYVDVPGTTYNLMSTTQAFSTSATLFAFIGFSFNPTISYSSSQIFTFSPAFFAAPTFKPTTSGIADTAGMVVFTGYMSSPTWTLGFLSGSATTPALYGYYSKLNVLRIAGSGATGTVANCFHYFCDSAGGVASGLTATSLGGLYVSNLLASLGTITEFVGVEIETLTRGVADISLRSRGAVVDMRHNGPVALGTAWPWLKIGSLAAPGTPTVTVVGTAGGTTYDYTVTAVTNIPGTPSTGETVASGTGTTNTGNATLSASNFNRLMWASSPGATKYRIYRTAGPGGAGLIGTYDVFVGSQQFDDTGFAAGAVAPTTNTTGALEVNGGLTLKRTTIANANYTALLTDCIIEITGLTVARTITLPTAASAGAGKIYICKKTTGSFVLNIAGNGAETVNGITPFPTTTATYRTVSVYCTGTEWLTFSEAL